MSGPGVHLQCPERQPANIDHLAPVIQHRLRQAGYRAGRVHRSSWDSLDVPHRRAAVAILQEESREMAARGIRDDQDIVDT